MRKLLLIAAALLGLTASIQAQQPGCPEISVTGPPGIVQPGEAEAYKVHVKAEEQPLDLQYVWSVSAGEILSGQGTHAIEVRRSKDTLTVTVEIIGPPGCRSNASETSIWEPAPVPEKIHEISEQESVENADLDQVIKSMLDRRDTQLYIQVGTIAGNPSDAVIAKERKVLERLAADGVDKSRITVARVYAENEMMRFWRVPPGAENPRCEECERLHNGQICPKISVLGPAGIVLPPNAVKFRAEITGTVPKDVRYYWTVTKGSIIRGQGTSVIETLPEHENEIKITATVEVAGLPEPCNPTASETYVVAADNFSPILLDEVPNSKVAEVFERRGKGVKDGKFDAIVDDFKNNAASQAYVIFGHEDDDSDAEGLGREERVLQILTNAGIGRDRITAARRTGPRGTVQVWRVPPGTEDPACEDCEWAGECVLISVIPLTLAPLPGLPAEFRGDLSPYVPRSAKFNWTVTNGRILEGQGTLEIRVYDYGENASGLTATLEVSGLDAGCRNSASVTMPRIDPKTLTPLEHADP